MSIDAFRILLSLNRPEPPEVFFAYREKPLVGAFFSEADITVRAHFFKFKRSGFPFDARPSEAGSHYSPDFCFLVIGRLKLVVVLFISGW